ncbi:MAG: 4-(cytidine 5'-diphospho)-2-C-methyl-D-erythritol kinase [Gammaproteobacteria bacterium]|nr:4-(cytidine 5'-diphospho)-2-C-methyl-D-erythritol kinase [Gammaproteobacteria bacterium]
MNKKLTITAPAKLNLFLHITGQREDGYHLLQTIFQFLDYADTISLTVREDGQINRTSELEGVPAETDLVVKAAKCLQQHCINQFAGRQLGADISVDKILPMGGGLGGGSSNAASVLVGLNHLWECGLSQQELMGLGVELGADVPIFIFAQSAWAEGVGEHLKAVDLPEKWFLVLKPSINVSTAKVFSNSQLRRDCSTITIRDFLEGQTENVCEKPVREMYPEVDQALKDLARYSGNGKSKLTGTGACVFAAFDNKEQADHALHELSKKWDGFVAKGMNQTPLKEFFRQEL